MTAPPSSIHKKLVFVSAGCGGVLVLFFVAGMISMRHLGIETPAQPRFVTPVQSSAALDSLSRFDFSGLFETAAPLEIRRCRATDTTRRVSPVPPSPLAGPPIAFGDTFPPGSAARRLWEESGSAVAIEAARGSGTPIDSLPAGRALLAAIRLGLDRDNRVDACIILSALAEKLSALETDPHLERVVAGAWLARDAAAMVARDTTLQALTGLTAERATALLAAHDARKRRLLDLRGTIDAAGMSPANADSLAAWARDERLPLPVRDAYVRAVGYGWVDDPQEMTFGVNPERRDAIERLLGTALPPALQEAARAARQVTQGNLAQRFQFGVTYRTNREPQP